VHPESHHVSVAQFSVMQTTSYSNIATKRPRLIGAIALLCGIFACLHVMHAIAISKAWIEPSGVVSELDEVELIVEISTGHSPAFLYQDTEIGLRRAEIIVRIYPDMGLLAVPDWLTERAMVGRLLPGAYRALVLLEPVGPVYGSPSFTVLDFTVVPILKAGFDEERHYVLWWEDPRRDFSLEWTAELGSGEWMGWGESPRYISGGCWVRITDPLESRFFRLVRNR
jgi:hypothetical protein